MKKKTLKVLLSVAATVAVALPALANQTTLTMNANVDSVISLRLEKDGATTFTGIVSGDDADRGAFAETANEILNFGMVSPLGTLGTNTTTIVDGTSATTGQSDNGTAGSIARNTISTLRTTYDPASTTTQPANGQHGGSIYTIRDAIQLRALRNDSGDVIPVAGGTTEVSVAVTGTDALEAVVAPDAQVFTTGTTLPANIFFAPSAALPGAFDTAGVQRVFLGAVGAPDSNKLAHDSAYPVSIGVHIPFNRSAGTSTTIITFSGQ